MSTAAVPDLALIPAGINVTLMFPKLTPAQIARVKTHGRVRRVVRGEVLVAAGVQAPYFYVVISGAIEVVRPGAEGETTVIVHHEGEFTGEVSMLSGRQSLVTLRVAEPGEVIEVEREKVLGLIQTDADLSEVLVRAFLLRRASLIAGGLGDVVLVGSNHCSDTLRIKEFLTRNGHPYSTIDPDTDTGVQELLDRVKVTEDDMPVVICRGETVLRNPTNRAIADCLGFNDAIDKTLVRDVVIVGAGPSGLAAAVYAASEGLDVLVLERNAPGGQAGASSRIENYLGFPTGISGQELTARAYTQAQKFGAQVMIAEGATELDCNRKGYTITVDNETTVPARTVIIATGAQYRNLPLPNISQFEGAGVYYSATFMESQLCGHEEVVVVGGGNSAGQAAVFLAQTAKMVHMLVRSRGLRDTMSRYLIRRIEESDTITLRTCTELTALKGEWHVEGVEWKKDDQSESRDIRHVFVMTGASPSTKWLDGCIALDALGFIKTGQDLTPPDLIAAGWPLQRRPHLLETSRPGIFAVGDVRAGNTKRVASAVGEGSIAVSFIHQALQE